MELNYGLEVWTTLSGLGISEKEDSFSNTTLAVKSSVLAIVLLVTGWLWVWRTLMSRFFTATNQKNTNLIFTKAVYSASNLPTLASGSCRPARTTS